MVHHDVDVDPDTEEAGAGMNDADDFFDLFQRSAQRLETRASDGPDVEAFRAFQEGMLAPAEWLTRRRWWREGVATVVREGRRVGRILVVATPLSPYWSWRTSIGSLTPGEDVGIVDRTEHPQLAQLDRDWWAFDFETPEPSVLLLDYAPDGAYLGRRHMTDPAVVAECRAELDLAQRLAVPLGDYLRATR
jgi:hypothetical protein